MINQVTAIELSRNAFARALRHGRGAAFMHVRAHGVDGVEDLVCSACLENKSYDRQCENHRGRWMFEMIKGTAAYPRIAAAIDALLNRSAIDRNSEQIGEIASLMAKDGDAHAALALRKYVWSQPLVCEGIAGGAALVSLDGVLAVVEIARRFGRYILLNPGEYVDSLDYLTESSGLHDVALDELTRRCDDDPAIAAFVARQQEFHSEVDNATEDEKQARRERYRDEVLLEMPVERILAAAAAHEERYPRMYLKFGRWARPADLERILQQIQIETDPEAMVRLLWVFRKAELPAWHERIWALAHGEDRKVRHAAIEALATLADPRIGEFGRERLRSGTFCVDDEAVIDLFVKNYLPGDEQLILGALQRLTVTDDQAHALGFRVREVCNQNEGAQIAGLAAWVYVTNPCTICRKSAVELLIESGNLPEVIASECMHDASADIRQLVNAVTPA